LAEKLFDSCFRDAAFGVLIMDSKQTIIKSNHCAHRYCRDLYRTLFHNINAVLSESEKTDLFIENYVINQFRKQLLSNNDHILDAISAVQFPSRQPSDTSSNLPVFFTEVSTAL
jgi:hypothetical protein